MLMKKIAILGLSAVVLSLVCTGCKKVYMVPTPQGWVEQEVSRDGNKVKYRPAEKIEVDYK
jgi:hypothetical protein